MLDFDIQTNMVGRNTELRELKKYLDRAREGRGNTVFISGEVGIGKSRLVNEIKDIAYSLGFQVLSGNCTRESLTQYLPFIEALRTINMDHLLTEKTPRIEVVYLITHGGMLIKDVKRQENALSADIFASMLIGLSNFVNETLSNISKKKNTGTLHSLGYENYRILIETGKSANLVVVITGRENDLLTDDIKKILEKIQKNYGKDLNKWDGDDRKLIGLEEHLKSLILSGKYDGMDSDKEHPEKQKKLLFENVSLDIKNRLKKTPILLCLEDLQWADSQTLALMNYIARDSTNSGLFILGTYQPEELRLEDGNNHPLLNTLEFMNREDLYKTIKLERLPEDNIPEFLDAIFKKNDFSDEFYLRIYKETEGNPLFIIQLAEHLVGEEKIKSIGGVWRLTENLKEFTIPLIIYNIIERRLARLEKEQRKIMDYASVIGSEFSSGILSNSLKLEKVHILELLRKIEHKHGLIRSQNGNHRFDHAMIKHVLYEQIPKDRRRRYHLEIAQSIENINRKNLDKYAGKLAFHYVIGRDNKKALHYLKKATAKVKCEYSDDAAYEFFNEIKELEEYKLKRSLLFENIGDIYD